MESVLKFLKLKYHDGYADSISGHFPDDLENMRDAKEFSVARGMKKKSRRGITRWEHDRTPRSCP